MCLTHKKLVINCNILSDARLENLLKLGKLKEEEVKETITYSNALRGERSSGPQTLMSNSTSLMRLLEQKHRKIYDAKNSWRRFNEQDLVWVEDDTYVGDPASNIRKDAENAYNYAGLVYDFCRDVLNRNSIDDQGMMLLSTIRYRTNYRNANWNGTGMSYGNGMTNCLDVVGHEMFHGVTEHTSGLVYEDEPGALNEHFSDVFGILVRQWNSQEQAGDSNWLLGENILPGVDAIRSMKNPGSLVGDDQINERGEPIDHYDRRYKGSADWGGVHMNSGIPNRAFYLAANEIGGFVWTQLGLVWYMTLKALDSNSEFHQAAEKSYSIAREFYSDNENISQAIWNGWDKVGITIDTNTFTAFSKEEKIRILL
jgi:Zn-dependent metalloprotease